jgi:tetratricopeptide (TPR) repeat protein
MLFAVEKKEYGSALAQVRRLEEAASRETAAIRADITFATSFLAGMAEIRNGRPNAARAQIERQRGIPERTPLQNSLHQWLQGEIALAAGDLVAADAAFLAAEPKFRASIGQSMLPGDFFRNLPFRDGPARVAIARGDFRSATDIYRKLLRPEDLGQKWPAMLEPRFVLALAKLLDRTGDHAAAREQYRRFLEMWKQADPGLPELAEAQRALREN